MSSSEAEPAEEHPEEPGADQIKEEPLEVAKSKSPESAEERERDVDMNADSPPEWGGTTSPSPQRAAQAPRAASASPSPPPSTQAGSASAPEPEPPVRVPSQAAKASGPSWETCSDETLALARTTSAALKARGGSQLTMH